MPKLVYIRVSSVGSVNLCAKSPEKESSYIRKEENYANFQTQFFNDFESTSERISDNKFFNNKGLYKQNLKKRLVLIK